MSDKTYKMREILDKFGSGTYEIRQVGFTNYERIEILKDGVRLPKYRGSLMRWEEHTWCADFFVKSTNPIKKLLIFLKESENAA